MRRKKKNNRIKKVSHYGMRRPVFPGYYGMGPGFYPFNQQNMFIMMLLLSLLKLFKPDKKPQQDTREQISKLMEVFPPLRPEIGRRRPKREPTTPPERFIPLSNIRNPINPIPTLAQSSKMKLIAPYA